MSTELVPYNSGENHGAYKSGHHPASISHRFKPGVSGNPHGRGRGVRNALSAEFLEALQADWQKHGSKAIAKMRIRSPARYVEMIAKLLPVDQGAADEDVAGGFLEVIRYLGRAAASKD